MFEGEHMCVVHVHVLYMNVPILTTSVSFAYVHGVCSCSCTNFDRADWLFLRPLLFLR
ncbi:hypothetical protein BC939DRAFT_465898 [Gamsiella multidivaricata]|uniref:uncharacterized protein n=1 Tax=Gamsiella multidivaricata TaxID=101098 RepID=UPI00221E5FE2|nr:uncharacterized protein BC939DRAFT_465898 [Gamsiella multidivaricata]KAI7817448.1 hypothetical protein BC939DRAFT_465898 [Gamsiella multidivaricata]